MNLAFACINAGKVLLEHRGRTLHATRNLLGDVHCGLERHDYS